MKRYLLLRNNDAAPNLVHTIEQMAVGKLVVSDLRDRHAQTLLEQLPDRERMIACLVTVNRGRIRAAAGRRAAWQLIRLLGPIQGWRVWHLVHPSQRHREGEGSNGIGTNFPSNVGR